MEKFVKEGGVVMEEGSIKFERDEQGRRKGTIYIKVQSEGEVRVARRKLDGTVMKTAAKERWVFVDRTTQAEYDNIEVPAAGSKGGKGGAQGQKGGKGKGKGGGKGDIQCHGCGMLGRRRRNSPKEKVRES